MNGVGGTSGSFGAGSTGMGTEGSGPTLGVPVGGVRRDATALPARTVHLDAETQKENVLAQAKCITSPTHKRGRRLPRFTRQAGMWTAQVSHGEPLEAKQSSPGFIPFPSLRSPC